MYLPTEVNVFALSLTLFHTFEPLLQWMHHPEQTGWDCELLWREFHVQGPFCGLSSVVFFVRDEETTLPAAFLLSNSYIAAQGLAVVEYIVERHFVPSTKGSRWALERVLVLAVASRVWEHFAKRKIMHIDVRRLALGAGLALIAAGEGLRKV